MKLIKTKSFELAINTNGDPNSGKLAICIPGRLDTKDYANFTSHLEFLASKGFYAIAFDPPGTWESPGETELFTTTNYIKAVNELIEHFGNKETLLLGHSRGGAVAILVGCPNPAVKGVVLVMSSFDDPTPPEPEDIEKGFKVSNRDLPPGDRETEEQKSFELPVNYWEDSKQYNVREVLKDCSKPKLLFAGTEDDFYSLEEMKEIFAQIPEPKQLHILNTEHDYRLHSEVIDEVNQITGQFLEKYLQKG